MHEPIGPTQFVVFEKKLQVPREKSGDFLLIIYMKRFEMVKQKQRTFIALFQLPAPFPFSALCLGLTDVLSANQRAEIFPCILWENSN